MTLSTATPDRPAGMLAVPAGTRPRRRRACGRGRQHRPHFGRARKSIVPRASRATRQTAKGHRDRSSDSRRRCPTSPTAALRPASPIRTGSPWSTKADPSGASTHMPAFGSALSEPESRWPCRASPYVLPGAGVAPRRPELPSGVLHGEGISRERSGLDDHVLAAVTASRWATRSSTSAGSACATRSS